MHTVRNYGLDIQSWKIVLCRASVIATVIPFTQFRVALAGSSDDFYNLQDFMILLFFNCDLWDYSNRPWKFLF